MAQSQEEEGEQQANKQMQQRLRALQIEQQKRQAIKRFMTAQAYERLMNVRVSNHELYTQLVDILIAMVQSNRISSQLTEEQLKQILSKLTYRKESTIKFQHK